MTAQNVHLKSRTSDYTCKTPTVSNLDSGSPKVSVLEERYAYILWIIGFTHCISYPLLFAWKHLLFIVSVGQNSFSLGILRGSQDVLLFSTL
jgi:hypothetical protein